MMPPQSSSLLWVFLIRRSFLLNKQLSPSGRSCVFTATLFLFAPIWASSRGDRGPQSNREQIDHFYFHPPRWMGAEWRGFMRKLQLWPEYSSQSSLVQLPGHCPSRARIWCCVGNSLCVAFCRKKAQCAGKLHWRDHYLQAESQMIVMTNRLTRPKARAARAPKFWHFYFRKATTYHIL